MSNKKIATRKLLCPKSGYVQHTNPNFQHTAVLPILVKMESNGKSK